MKTESQNNHLSRVNC